MSETNIYNIRIFKITYRIALILTGRGYKYENNIFQLTNEA